MFGDKGLNEQLHKYCQAVRSERLTFDRRDFGSYCATCSQRTDHTANHRTQGAD